MPGRKPSPVIEPAALQELAAKGTEVTVGELREALGVTLAELALRAGLSKDEVAAAEERGTWAGTGNVTKCLRALGFTATAFIDGSGKIRATRDDGAAFTIL